MVFTVFGATITIVLNFWLVPEMGYMGAAWATLGCYALMMLLSYITGQRKYHVPYETGRVLGYIGLSLCFYFLSLLFVRVADPSLAWKLVFNSTCLAAYLYLLGRMEKPPAINPVSS